MGENLKDSGIATEWQMNNGRIVFKLNEKTIACFEKNKDGSENPLASDVTHIMIDDKDHPIDVEYFNKEKDGKTYHNLTKISLSEGVEETVASPPETVSSFSGDPGESKDSQPKNFNSEGAAFGLSCNLALRVLIKRDRNLTTEEGWREYRTLVQKFYETNSELRKIILDR